MLVRIETKFATLDATSPRYRSQPRMWFRFVGLTNIGKPHRNGKGGFSMIDAPADEPRATHTTTKKMRVWEVIPGSVFRPPRVHR